VNQFIEFIADCIPNCLARLRHVANSGGLSESSLLSNASVRTQTLAALNAVGTVSAQPNCTPSRKPAALPADAATRNWAKPDRHRIPLGIDYVPLWLRKTIRGLKHPMYSIYIHKNHANSSPNSLGYH
jgi:hypothetical protein